jgi:hypothetical protein
MIGDSRRMSWRLEMTMPRACNSARARRKLPPMLSFGGSADSWAQAVAANATRATKMKAAAERPRAFGDPNILAIEDRKRLPQPF